MKKILFVVASHGDELAGLKLFVEYPYGKVHDVSWEIVMGNPNAAALNQRFVDTDLTQSFNTIWPQSYEERRAQILRKRVKKYDVIYDIHTTSTIKTADLDDAIVINSLTTEALSACMYVQAPHIIFDKKTVEEKTSMIAHHPLGVMLKYQKTNDADYDFIRIENDFLRIINMHQSKNTPKHLYETTRTITMEEKKELHLDLVDFRRLDTGEKKRLNLSKTEEYVAGFIEQTGHEYCSIHRKIRDVMHFDAWMRMGESVKKID